MGIPIYVVARCHFRTEVGGLKEYKEGRDKEKENDRNIEGQVLQQRKNPN